MGFWSFGLNRTGPCHQGRGSVSLKYGSGSSLSHWCGSGSNNNAKPDPQPCLLSHASTFRTIRFRCYCNTGYPWTFFLTGCELRIYIFLVVLLSQIIYILNDQLSASVSCIFVTVIEWVLYLELTREEPHLSTNSQVRKIFLR
jgi:hypothetical protein